MNLFTNLYNDVDEIREWLKEDKEAADLYLSDHKETDIGQSELSDISEWLHNHEAQASKYREFHYGRQWNL